MGRSTHVASVLAVALLAGCAAPSKYTWGNYDGSLYRYYKDATTADAHIAELKSIIDAAEAGNARVAPGLHAEYGYFLLQGGRNDEARLQFEKEKALWPESVRLMDTMLKLADGRKQISEKGEAK